MLLHPSARGTTAPAFHANRIDAMRATAANSPRQHDPSARTCRGRILAVSLVLAAACTVEQPPADDDVTADLPATAPITDAAPDDTVRAVSFICEDLFRFTFVPQGTAGTLFLPDTALPLQSSAAATGLRYTRAGVELWFDAAAATLNLPDTTYTGCAVREGSDPWTAARLRGATFRAVGQEPGWYLEVEPDRVTFVGDYGERTMTVPARPPVRDGEALAWHVASGDHEIRITASPRPCADAMSGEAFRYTVQVVADGNTYRGCGRRFD
jgi:hypothetical protein